MKRNLVFLLALVAVVSSAAACRNAYDRRTGASYDAMIAAATPCPAPAICVRKMTAATREVSVCAPDVAPSALAVGDVVVTSEMKNHQDIGSILARHGQALEISFADGSKFERTPDRILGRLCR